MHAQSLWTKKGFCVHLAVLRGMKTKSRIREKVRQGKGKPSPFETRTNSRAKRAEKQSVSRRRSQAEEERRRTIGEELKNESKRNEFYDERIGEKDKMLADEDRMLSRLKREHSKRFRKSSVYNLENSDEEGEMDVLTHGGMAIDEYEDGELFGGFDDGEDDENENDGKHGLGSANAVKQLNFGGGFVRKEPAGEGR